MPRYRAVLVYEVADDELWSEPTSLAKALENASYDSDAQIRVLTWQSSVEKISDSVED